jgi:hypothetical protein
VRIGQAAALRCFWHPQIMPDLSLCQTCIKPYENKPRRLIDALFLPTLKPEEPKHYVQLHRASVAFIAC